MSALTTVARDQIRIGVAVDGGLYVRAYNNQKSTWYQAAMRQKAGRIVAAGMAREVTFEPVSGPLDGRIDEAYTRAART